MTRGGTSLAPQTHAYDDGGKKTTKKERKKKKFKSWQKKILLVILVFTLTPVLGTFHYIVRKVQADYHQSTLVHTHRFT